MESPLKIIFTSPCIATTLILLSVWQLVSAATEYSEVIKQSDWPEYENGTNIIALPQISKTLKRFKEDEKISIEIHYPGGEIGKQWAASLSKWLVAYGIPGNYVELLPGSGGSDQLIIQLIDRR